MSIMTAARAGLPRLDSSRPLTVADLDLLPDDGNRYELDDGVLVVSPPPANVHQLVASRLQMLLGAACPADFFVVSGNGVAITQHQYRIPDLVVVRDEDFDLTAKSVTRPPELAIEVASPGTALYDRNRKKAVYADFGIPRYWIVTPSVAEPSLTVFELQDRIYAEVANVVGEQVYKADRPFPVEICPARLVARRAGGGEH